MDDPTPRGMKCSSCGAPLHYEAGKAIARCAHCGTEFAVDEVVGRYDVEPVTAEPPPPEPPKQAEAGSEGVLRRPLSTVIVILLIACGLLCGFCFICGVIGTLMESNEYTADTEPAEEFQGERGGVPSLKEPLPRPEKSYKEGSGDVLVSVDECKITKSVPQRFSGPEYAKGDWWFVWVKVTTLNTGKKTEHVNPNDFTLSTPAGYTTSHDTETYALEDHFGGVDLPPGGSTGGWLIFKSTKEEYYKLNFSSGWDDHVTIDVHVTGGA